MIRLAWMFAPFWALCLLVVWFCDLFDPPEPKMEGPETREGGRA